MNYPILTGFSILLLTSCTHATFEETRPDGTTVSANYLSTRDVENISFSAKRNPQTGELEAMLEAGGISASNPLAAGSELVKAGADAVLRGAAMAAGVP